MVNRMATYGISNDMELALYKEADKARDRAFVTSGVPRELQSIASEIIHSAYVQFHHLDPNVIVNALKFLINIDWNPLISAHNEKIDRRNHELNHIAKPCSRCRTVIDQSLMKNIIICGEPHPDLFCRFCDKCIPLHTKEHNPECTKCGKLCESRSPPPGDYLCGRCKAADRMPKKNSTLIRAVIKRSSLTAAKWKLTLKAFEYKCAYCPGEYEAYDHVVPIHKGGETTRWNLVPSCVACNARKGKGSAGYLDSRFGVKKEAVDKLIEIHGPIIV